MGHLIVPGKYIPKSVWDPLVYEIAFLYGVTYAEIGLIATFAALGTKNVTYRYLLAVAVLFSAVTTLIVGQQPGNIAILYYLHAYVAFFAYALFLTIWRHFTGIYISDGPNCGAPMARPSNFSIGYLFLATTVAAIMLVVGWRTLGPAWLIELRNLPWTVAIDISGRLIETMILILLPCIWIALADRYRFNAFLALLVLIICSSLFLGPRFAAPVAAAFSLGLVSISIGVLLIYRHEGYRIISAGKEISLCRKIV